MTQWNPVWLVEIDGVAYTNAVLANLTIRSGRTNIYEQAQAGYVNLQLLDVDQTAIPVAINSTISFRLKIHQAHLCPFLAATSWTLVWKCVT
jgi:hypothetical protein